MSDPVRALESLRQQFDQDLAGAGTESDLRTLRDKYLSRKGGLISTLLKSLGAAPAEERPRLGQLANAAKEHIERVSVSASRQRRGPVRPRVRSTSRCRDEYQASAIAIR